MIWIGFAAALSVMLLLVALRAWLQRAVSQRRRLLRRSWVEETAFWTIGGIEQAVQFRGEDEKNPLLVYLHGGPGLPVMPFAHAFQREWERRYTVVHWDQRNAGKTLAKNGPEDGLTLQHYVDDGLELVRLLRQRFPHAPIVLLGHSWGTAIAVEMLLAQPDAFAAYVAIGQVSDFLMAERYGYETVLDEARRRRDASVLKALSRYPDYARDRSPCPAATKVVRAAQMKLGFGHHTDKRAFLKLFGLAFRSPDYSWRELLSLANGKAQAYSLALALRELPDFAGRVRGAKLKSPIIMIGGSYDLFTPTPMARTFFDTFDAPFKEFIEIPTIAHFGPLEDPAAISTILIDQLWPRVRQRPSE
ncbi:alpha/beta fold hydrolase [Jiella mangrovi]|uniref:Alpha/beta hydrolase n=1 Tax=Jiella mangrovi TaxID=2821407 RepID=A0ABS4BG91_9HYPH|nr:alpha/beta hydrolase [Jiella mangrovi]MBP0615768.1 alpha/beta hydrolase [Jiella mangrovi]